MWKAWKPHPAYVYGAAQPGFDGTRRRNESLEPRESDRRGNPSGPSRAAAALPNRSSSQPYHANTVHSMQIPVETHSNRNIRSVPMSRRSSTPLDRNLPTLSSGHSYIAGGIQRGRSDSVHQLRQSVRFGDVFDMPSHERHSRPAGGRHRASPSPAYTSDSATLNGDENAVFEDSEEEDESGEEDDEDEDDVENEVGDIEGAIKMLFEQEAVEFRRRRGAADTQSNVRSANCNVLDPDVLSDFLRLSCSQTKYLPPVDDYSIRQDAGQRAGVRYSNGVNSPNMRFARTGSFSRLEASSNREHLCGQLKCLVEFKFCYVCYRPAVLQ